LYRVCIMSGAKHGRGRGMLTGALIRGDGSYRCIVVGESFHQADLERIAGGRTERGANFECAGVLCPEPHNPYDRNAVCVLIDGCKVGHLPRDIAPEFRAALAAGGYAMAACKARIVGGWYRSSDDSGSFGVKLDAIIPFELEAAPRVDVPPQQMPWPLVPKAPKRNVGQWLTRAVLIVGAIVGAIWLLAK